MKFSNKKAIVFDLDGTLANTISAITEAINLTMEEYGYPTHSEDDVQRAIGNGATNLIRKLVPPLIAQDNEKVLQVRKIYDKKYALTYLHTREIYDGIEDLLKDLRYNKDIAIAVFSNKQDEYTKALCAQLFDEGIITLSVGQTDLPLKPDPTALNKILEDLNVTAEECIMVGDSDVDYDLAKNAGVDFIGVTWGYGREKLLTCCSENLVDNAEDILKIIN